MTAASALTTLMLVAGGCGATAGLTPGSREASAADAGPSGSEAGPPSLADSGLPPVPSRGKHVFFAFGKADPDNPQGQKDLMARSVRKVADDVRALAGDHYDLEVRLDPAQISVQSIKERLAQYARTLGADDTFVMYSHTHGVPGGLNLDFDRDPPGPLSWIELARAILALPARNVVVFTMACHSGYLTDALKKVSATWQGRALEGRNLIVLASVAADQLSGSSDDPAIGNPFTFAVLTALRGAADGFGGKTADGRVDMEELKTYVISTAHDKSTGQEHRPQFAGEYVSSDIFATYPR